MKSGFCFFCKFQHIQERSHYNFAFHYTLGLSGMPTIVVRDYNILSNFSDNAEKLSNCAKEHVNADTRFDLIQKRIERLVEEKAIICLQEVPQVWGNRLLTYFYQNDYFFIPSYYSNYVSGRMGVGIAFPRSLYNLEESHIIT